MGAAAPWFASKQFPLQQDHFTKMGSILQVFNMMHEDEPVDCAFVNAHQMLKAQQMKVEEAQPSLTLAQLKDELYATLTRGS